MTVSELLRLRDENREAGEIVDAYRAIDAVYRSTLKAMGRNPEVITAGKSAAQVTLATGSPSSSAMYYLPTKDK